MAKYNRNFAKLNEGRSLVYAPLPLIVNGENVWTNTPEVYIGQGYYPLIKTDMPVKEGFYYTSYWTYDTDNKICHEEWEEHKIPTPVEAVTEEEIKVVIQEGVNSIDD